MEKNLSGNIFERRINEPFVSDLLSMGHRNVKNSGALSLYNFKRLKMHKNYRQAKIISFENH